MRQGTIGNETGRANEGSRARGLRVRVGTAAVLATTAMLVAAGTASAVALPGKRVAKKQLTTVTVSGLVPIEPVNPFLNAQATNAFAKEGINLKIADVTNAGVEGIPLLASGRVQVLVGGLNAGVYTAIEQGVKFKYVGDVSTTNGSLPSPAALDVTTKPVHGKKITSVKQLKGMTVAINGGPGATGAYLLGALLKRYGLRLNQVKILNVAFPDMEKAVQSGAAQAAIAAPPFNLKMEAAGVSRALVPTPGRLPGISVFYSDSFAKTPAAQRFFDALVIGEAHLQGAAKRSPKNLKILAKATGFTLAQLKSLPFSYYPRFACPSAAAFKLVESLFTQGGVIKLSTPVNPKGVVDAHFCAVAKRQIH